MDYITYNGMLKDAIQAIFTHFVIPSNLIPVLKKHNSGILTEKDQSLIHSTAQNSGNMEGARVLLEHMIRYEHWFKSLILALQDPQNSQIHVANQILAAREKLDHRLREQSQQNGAAQQRRPTQETFGELKDDFRVEPEGPGRGENNGEYSELDPDGPMEREDDGYDHIADSPEPEQEPDYAEPIESSVQPLHSSNQARLKPPSHGKEYDFSKEETETAMSTFSGWHPTADIMEVNRKLVPCRTKNGNYILWYWVEEKRPAISVTYNGTLTNFIIHKKPSKSIRNLIKYYFINKKQHKASTISELVLYHKTHGILHTEEGHEMEIIHLRRPWSEESQ